MSVAIHHVHNVLRTYEKAFKTTPPIAPEVQSSPPQRPDRVSISQDALAKLGETQR